MFSDVYNFKIALGQDQNCLKIYYLKKSIFLSNKYKILNNLYITEKNLDISIQIF